MIPIQDLVSENHTVKVSKNLHVPIFLDQALKYLIKNGSLRFLQIEEKSAHATSYFSCTCRISGSLANVGNFIAHGFVPLAVTHSALHAICMLMLLLRIWPDTLKTEASSLTSTLQFMHTEVFLYLFFTKH